MIAIYDQKKYIKGKDFEIWLSDKKIQMISVAGVQDLCVPFDTVEQAQYVLDQIAQAIERGDKLYRLPSVEEVEFAMERPCLKCIFNYDKSPGKTCTEAQYYKCLGCVNKSNWQPKD